MLGYTEAVWFHAANSAVLVQEALNEMADALARFTQPEASQDRRDVVTYGIEMDVRVVFRRSSDSGSGEWVAVLHHDPLSDEQRQEAYEADSLPERFFTLAQCFDAMVRSQWFAQQQARRDDSPGRLFRLVVKLDFKDPRAAEVFHDHTCAQAGEGLWCSYQRLCTLLQPRHELSVWWNADVVPSALLLNDDLERGRYAALRESPNNSCTDTVKESVFDYAMDSFPSLRFIDIPQAMLVDLISRTVAGNVAVHVAPGGDAKAIRLGLSLGWVLKLPPANATLDDVNTYRHHAPYHAQDTMRMAELVSKLWAALPNQDVVPELVTYAVLWEAVFAPEKMLDRISPALREQKADDVQAAATEVEEDTQACDALAGLMQHTQALLTGAASTTPCDSPRGFLTFWKVRGADSLNDPRARVYFPWCTIDG